MKRFGRNDSQPKETRIIRLGDWVIHQFLERDGLFGNMRSKRRKKLVEELRRENSSFYCAPFTHHSPKFRLNS